MVRAREIRILVGTDAASEGLNLQRLGTLINLDLPWKSHPTGAAERPHSANRAGSRCREHLQHAV